MKMYLLVTIYGKRIVCNEKGKEKMYRNIGKLYIESEEEITKECFYAEIDPILKKGK